MVRITSEDVTPKPTFLAKIPLLNVIEEIRLKIVDWIWREADIKGITADNIIKAAVIAGIMLPLAAATVGNLFYGLALKLTNNISFALFLGLALTAYTVKYFIDPNVGTLNKIDVFMAPIAFLATIFAILFVVVAGPYIAPIAEFFAGLFKQTTTTSMLTIVEKMLTVGSLTVNSQTGAVVTIKMLPVIGSYTLVMGIFALGNFIEWVVDELRALFKS